MLTTFQERLNFKLKEAGYTSESTASGFDVLQLSKSTGIKYEMCRRYTLGEAVPSIKSARKIASHLNVSLAWLLLGEDPSNNVDTAILQKCIHEALSEIEASNQNLSTDKVAKIITIYYKSYSQYGIAPKASDFIALASE